MAVMSSTPGQEARPQNLRQTDRGRAIGWIAAALPGIALVSVAVM